MITPIIAGIAFLFVLVVAAALVFLPNFNRSGPTHDGE